MQVLAFQTTQFLSVSRKGPIKRFHHFLLGYISVSPFCAQKKNRPIFTMDNPRPQVGCKSIRAHALNFGTGSGGYNVRQDNDDAGFSNGMGRPFNAGNNNSCCCPVLQPPWRVTSGAIIGHMLATSISIFGGASLANYISEKLVGYIGGTLLIVFGVATFFGVF